MKRKRKALANKWAKAIASMEENDRKQREKAEWRDAHPKHNFIEVKVDFSKKFSCANGFFSPKVDSATSGK